MGGFHHLRADASSTKVAVIISITKKITAIIFIAAHTKQ